MEAAALLALEGPAGDEIADIDHVAQLADVAVSNNTNNIIFFIVFYFTYTLCPLTMFKPFCKLLRRWPWRL